VAGKPVWDAGWESAVPEVAAEVEEVPGRSQREQAWGSGSAAPGASGRGGSLQVLRDTRGMDAAGKRRTGSRRGPGARWKAAQQQLLQVPERQLWTDISTKGRASLALPLRPLIYASSSRTRYGHRALQASTCRT
jgi:hypothetical protein